jgi:hypothetical protein
MTPEAILKGIRNDGITLTLSPSGAIKAAGSAAAVSRWQTTIREHREQIIAVLEVQTIRAWLDRIGETDPVEIADVIHKCRVDRRAREDCLNRWEARLFG